MSDFKRLNPDFKEDIQERLTRQFFMKLMGFDLTIIELGHVEGEVEITEDLLQQNYFVHGGVMATASDIVMGFAAYSLLPKDYGVVTVDLSVQFLNPGIGDKLKAIGKVVKPGRNVTFCEAEIYMLHQGHWTLTNTARSTMYKVDASLGIKK